MSEGTSAGASAAAQYEQRLARHKEAARRRRPYLLALAAALAIAGLWLLTPGQVLGPSTQIFGWLLIALAASSAFGSFVTPNSITAWLTGAEGELRTAKLLEPLHADGFRMVHDRRIPGSRTNIDHIVIGPPGVYVVETKSYKGDVRIRGSDVYVGGRRRTSSTVDEVLREAQAVQAALADELEKRGLRVIPVLCVHHASLPWLRSQVHGIPIVSGKGLVKLLRKPAPIVSPADVQLLGDLAEARLRPAYVRPTPAPTAAREPTAPV